VPERRRHVKELRKDKEGPREASERLHEEIRSTDVEPLERDPNRDRARGDWDRTGRHFDESTEGEE
jgi:hypothetical protein